VCSSLALNVFTLLARASCANPELLDDGQMAPLNENLPELEAILGDYVSITGPLFLRSFSGHARSNKSAQHRSSRWDISLRFSIIRQRDQRSRHFNLSRKILRSLFLLLDSTLGRCSKLGQNAQAVKKASTLNRAERDRCNQCMSLDCWFQQQVKPIWMSGYCSPESQ
jgi:hypothetical protein